MGEILDDIARTVAAGGSRRAALKKLSGGLAGLLLAGLLPKETAAAPVPCGGPCPSGCCNPVTNVCVTKCPAGRCCNPGSGVCETTCPGVSCCNTTTGVCVAPGRCPGTNGQPGCCDISNDLAVCVAKCPSGTCCDGGACFNYCLGGCCDTVTGVCVAKCPAGTCCASGAAAPFATCAAVCPSGSTCDAGSKRCLGPITCPSNPSGCFSECSGAGQACFCVSIVGGGRACVVPICTFQPCTTNAQCGPGSVCFTQGCCNSGPPQRFCIPRCSNTSGPTTNAATIDPSWGRAWGR